MAQDGWVAPQTDEDVQREFFGKHGQDSVMHDIDRRWRILGKLIEKGSRIRDGYLGR